MSPIDPLSTRGQWHDVASAARIFLGRVRRTIIPFGLREAPSRGNEPVYDFRAELDGPSRGDALLCYLPAAFELRGEARSISSHSNLMMSFELACALNRSGYSVDVIDYRHWNFSPRKRYEIVIGMTANFSRLVRAVQPKYSIYFATRSAMHFEIDALRSRYLNLQARRNVAMAFPYPDIGVIECGHLESVNAIFVVGNERTASTYSIYQRPTFCLPNIQIRPMWRVDGQVQRDYRSARNRFVMLVNGSMIHKGVDLALEVFAKSPNMKLTLFAPERDIEFMRLYRQELFHSPNIHFGGWINLNGSEFRRACEEAAFGLSLSCSEGMSGAMLNMMAAGLIPVATPTTGVELSNFGFEAEYWTVEGIRQLLHCCVELSPEECSTRSNLVLDTMLTTYNAAHFRQTISSSLDAVLSRPQ